MLARLVIPGSALELDLKEQNPCAFAEVLSVKGRTGSLQAPETIQQV